MILRKNYGFISILIGIMNILVGVMMDNNIQKKQKRRKNPINEIKEIKRIIHDMFRFISFTFIIIINFLKLKNI
jgi:hypothetical protein